MTKKHYLLLSLAVIILDQLSKQYIARTFTLNQSVVIIEGYFNLTYITNPGIAFGIFSRKSSSLLSLILISITSSAIIFIFIVFKNLPAEDNRIGKISLSLIMGGAIGNLIDRLLYKEVIDFLDFHWREYHWPFFNLADSCITLGMFLFMYHLVKEKRES